MEDRKCVQCGKTFQISDSEKDFYVKKNLHLPKRCSECRKKNNPINEDHKDTLHPYQGHRNNQSRVTNAKKPSILVSVLLLIGVFLLVGIFYFNSKIDEWFPDQMAQLETYASEQLDITQAPQVADTTQVEYAAQIEDATQIEDTPQIEETTEAEEITEAEKVEQVEEADQPTETGSITQYTFRSTTLLEEHFADHGSEFGYATALQYQSSANVVISSPDALTKSEAEDGDIVFYLESTNEFVILSLDGFIRTYFKPDRGIDYYNEQ